MISLGKCSKIPLRLRYHPFSNGVPPSAFHFLQRTPMRVVAAGHHVLEVAILRLDHLIGRFAVVREVAGSAQLLARHRLHGRVLVSVSYAC